ncbi:hypothetical protein [Kribbella deserti]|uniref:Asparagine synthase n=1 Tax=Kribbella deserti TaxID=1926257 RepID=A0ABV6QTW2_9ACTN
MAENCGGAESLLIEGDASHIRIAAGTGGVCPLYIALDGSLLRGSWNPADLLRWVSHDQLVDRAVTRLLTRRQRYSAETMFDGLYKVTERAVATVDRSGISIAYPEPAEHVVLARKLRQNSDPVAVFAHLLGDRISPLVRSGDVRLAVEVSGGLDSATVAIAATCAGARDGLVSAGLEVDGEVGTQQAARRRAIVDRLRLRDIAALAAERLPFEADGPRSADRLHYADGDVYLESFDQLRTRLHGEGVQAVLTGFGGDELMALRSAERADGSVASPQELPAWLGERARSALPDLENGVAPVSPVAVPTLMVFAARNPAYIVNGLWPVAPLADAHLLRLCESLPVPWRAEKTLLRGFLQQAGFGPNVTHPKSVESFGTTMDAAMSQTGKLMLGQMLDDSILIDLGYVDRRDLSLVHTQMARGAAPPPLLYDTLAVERSLQSVRSAAERNSVPR